MRDKSIRAPDKKCNQKIIFPNYVSPRNMLYAYSLEEYIMGTPLRGASN